MKKIYLPSEEELHEIDNAKNANLYKYILAKVVEKLLASNIYIRDMDKSIRDIKELTDAIYYIYPQELSSNNKYNNDAKLCMRILNKESNDAIYNLDNLARFNDDVLNNFGIIVRTIELLHNMLPKNPEYRFCYRNNILLDNIFNVYIQNVVDLSSISANKLTEIEPIYCFRYPNETSVNDDIRLAVAIDEYTHKYGIPYYTGREYQGKSLMNNPDEKVKKLIKYLYK